MENYQLKVASDFEYLTSFLPEGWREQAKESGALRRCRKVPDADTLLRVLLIHLAEGCSLRETAALARQGGLLELSDVAIMDRLRHSSEWFRWMNEGIMRSWMERSPAVVFGDRFTVRIVDGTRVCEPGPTGSSWQIHYSIRLPSLGCDELILSAPRGPGESFSRFTVRPGDLLIGDRAFGVRPGIFHVVRGGGEVLARFALDNLPLERAGGGSWGLLSRLRKLAPFEIGDWAVELNWRGERISGRVCALRKSRPAAEKARRDVIRQAQKQGHSPKAQTLEAAGYLFVFTTVLREFLPARSVLEIYRGRWQIEMVFKRLKSILGFGHLRKTDDDSARAWLNGKLLVAFLVDVLIRRGEDFFPWGYPLGE